MRGEQRGQGVLEELLADVSSYEEERGELLQQTVVASRALQIALLQRAAPQDLIDALSTAIQVLRTSGTLCRGCSLRC